MKTNSQFCLQQAGMECVVGIFLVHCTSYQGFCMSPFELHQKLKHNNAIGGSKKRAWKKTFPGLLYPKYLNENSCIITV